MAKRIVRVLRGTDHLNAFLTRLRGLYVDTGATEVSIVGFEFDLLDPLRHAAKEVQEKLEKKPDELWHSAKLYRAIDDIEQTALMMTRYRGVAKELVTLAQDMRRVSGWSVAD